MNGARILVAEDDAELRSVLVRSLAEEGFIVEGAADGAQFLGRVDFFTPDVLIVDIGLPDADGRDLCQALRARGMTTPVIFLTARDSLAERLSGFDAGGDDYVTKPFALAELVARLNVALRRAGTDVAVEGRGLRVDPIRHTVSCGSEERRLTPTEFRLLARLLAESGDVIRRRELVRAGWSAGAVVHDNTLDAYIARIRRKLRELPGAPALVTVHGVGYRVG